MPFNLAEYFQKQGLKVVEFSLKDVVGKPVVYVRDDAHFRQYVTQPGWNTLPLAIRLLMKRQFALWDKLYQDLRAEVYDLEGFEVQLRPDGLARAAELVRKHFGPPSPVAPAAPPTEDMEDTGTALAPPPLAKPAIPRAMPVGQKKAGPIPMAQPVQPATSAQPSQAASTPTSHSEGPPVGIDLGTTYSAIAYIDSSGRPCTLQNADGERLTPSVVLFGSEETLIGKQALLGSALEPDRTAICVKRDMGAKFYRRKINGEYMPPEVISSFILRSLKGDAERTLGNVTRAVITVPAYFDETRRRATVDAGRLAGLEVLDIINEPTAAAIAYGHHLGLLDPAGHLLGSEPMRVLVFDLGGGTFDVTIVEIQPNDIRALATDGDVNLGGRDWDEKIVDFAAEQFRKQFRDDPRQHPISSQELWLAAESAKRTLSERQKAVLHVCHLGSRFKVEMTRQEFEEASASLLERTRMTTELVVRQAGLTFADLDRILLVGGATRMPMITRMLEELTGKPPERSISADEAVATGAALYASTLVPAASEDQPAASFSVTNINSHSLGILGTKPDTGKQFNKVLIPKNTPLPCTVTKKFKTYRHGQRAVLIKVLEGESEEPGFCSAIGVASIRDLPPNLPAGWPIEVTYSYERNGQLHLTAKLKDYDAGITTDFLRENRLPDEDLEAWAHYVKEELSGPNAEN